jgi:hypothetical protein
MNREFKQFAQELIIIKDIYFQRPNALTPKQLKEKVKHNGRDIK